MNVHDFMGEGGRATPYGIYDIGKNEGFVNLISNTTNSSNLKVKAVVSNPRYKTGVTVSDEDMKALSIAYDDIHPMFPNARASRRQREERSR